MNTATIMDLAWEGAQIAFRLIMAARSRGDAESMLHQLRALGPAQRADVDAIERERLGELAATRGRFPQPVLDGGEED